MYSASGLIAAPQWVPGSAVQVHPALAAPESKQGTEVVATVELADMTLLQMWRWVRPRM